MIGSVCTCGARYGEFRATGDAGRVLSFAEVQAMLRVGSDDPALWLNKSRAAVLRFWGQLKRDQWEVTHGYCASVAETADEGDTSFDVETFDNATVTPVVTDRCDCDHCICARAVGATPSIHRFTYSTRKGPDTMTRSTINLRRTLAAYTARREDKRPGPMPCAVDGCTSEGKPLVCPADGELHSHGAVHFEHCHSDLVFRKSRTWLRVCDEHHGVLVIAREVWAQRPNARLGCACERCGVERTRHGEDACAWLQNGGTPCDRDHLTRGAACSTCQLAWERGKHPARTS